MKREILFRGKRFDDGEWIEGFYFYKYRTQEHGIHCSVSMGVLMDRAFEVIPETVSQFTGLTDKNGVKIFEGDIVKGISNNPFSMGEWGEYVVIWGVDHWHIKDTYFTLQELFNNCNNKIEVIGNIHDNKELIK